MTKTKHTRFNRMSTKYSLVALGIALFVNINSFSFAQFHLQHASLIGILYDAGSGDPLFGATIELMGTNRGTFSDSQGIFRVINLPKRTYAVKITGVGYESLVINSILPSEDETLKINLRSDQLRIDSLTAIECTKWREDAKKETTNAKIVRIMTGGFANPDSAQKVFIASVSRKYGYENTYHGCAADLCETVYNKIIFEWLDKRNGKGWRERESKDFERLWKGAQ